MPIRNAKTPKHYSAPTTHAPDNSPGRHRTTWVASTFNERRPNGTPQTLPKRQPRLRHTPDTRTQHRLDIPRHSRHHINDLPLLGTTPSHHDHRRNHVGISTPTTQTRHQRTRTSRNPPRNRRPTRLGRFSLRSFLLPSRVGHQETEGQLDWAIKNSEAKTCQ